MLRYDQLIASQFDVKGTSGPERICQCPFHNDGGKPNLYVNADTGLYFCHSCGAKGTLSKSTRSEQTELVLSSIQDKLRNPKRDRMPLAQPESWLDRFDFDHPDWFDRFDEPTIERFRLGYDPVSDKLTIPIRNIEGQPTGVILRLPKARSDAGERPKYMHPTGFKMGRTLFASHLVDDIPHVALCEGPLDAVACWEAGVPALGLFGARLSEDQRLILQRLGIHHVTCMTDNDPAGDHAVMQIKEQLRGTGIVVTVGWYRDGWPKDPGELTPAQRRQMWQTAVPYHKAWS